MEREILDRLFNNIDDEHVRTFAGCTNASAPVECIDADELLEQILDARRKIDEAMKVPAPILIESPPSSLPAAMWAKQQFLMTNPKVEIIICES